MENEGKHLTAKEALDISDQVIHSIFNKEMERIYWIIRHTSQTEGKTYERILSQGTPENIKKEVILKLKREGYKAKYHTWKSNGATILVLSWGELSIREVLRIK